MKEPGRNILFIMPPASSNDDIVGKNLAPYREIPYGLLSMAGYIKKYGSSSINITILDLNTKPGQDFESVLISAMEQLHPDIVGISGLFNSMFDDVTMLSKIIKGHQPDTVLVVGGNIATNCYDVLFRRNGYIDGACYSEGERPMLQLAEAGHPLDFMEEHPSWITRKKISSGYFPVPAFIQNLDDIPPVDYSMIDLSAYDSRCRNNNPVTYHDEQAVRLPFITTRGCPFNCVFCAASSLSGKKVRFMSAERVISDIKTAQEKFGMTRLVINDDQALIDRKRIKKILDELAGLGLILEFPSGLNVRFIDEEIAFGLKRAGLDVVNLAIESGSEHVLKNIIDKPLNIKDIRPAVDALRKAGLLVHAFFIFGFPDEKEEDRRMTVDLIKTVGFDWSNIYAAAPLRGSRLYKICVDKGYIPENDDMMHANIYASSIKTAEADARNLTDFVYRVNLDVNFVNNYRMKTGDFETARGYFDNVATNHPSHAFAHYCLARAYEGLGNNAESAERHMQTFREITDSDSKWKGYAGEFGLI